MHKLLTILLGVLFLSTQSQTVIEMAHPGDANLILLEVDSKDKADIVVYKTELKEEVQEWDCKWKFKEWGFSNFSIYIAKDSNDPLLTDEETGRKFIFHAKVYFTESIAEAGYQDPNFRLEGVFRKVAKNDKK